MHDMAYTQNHKVAIPKLDRGPPPAMRAAEKNNREERITRACKTCRRRKVKCSGDVPRCTNCHANNLNCVYEQARRDRLKEATDLNHTFATLFKEFSSQLSEADRRRVEDVIEAAEDDMITTTPTQSVKSSGKRIRQGSHSENPDTNNSHPKHGEAHVTASVGSNEDLDFLDEDLLRTRESRETGYVGQNSEVQWLRTVQRQAESNESEPFGQTYGPPGTGETAANERSEALHERRRDGEAPRHVTDATFYLDSDNIELDIAVNPYELPDPEIAEQLLTCYMNTVHSSFPIVPSSFEDQVRRFIGSLKQNKAFQVPDRWRALMNLIFAIGAKYSHLIDTEWRGDDRDHLVYMTRASHLLGMNNTITLVSAPDLSLVQATAVFSFYFLVIGHVSRAWLMIGISIRLALALGLHLRNEDPNADKTKKEMLLRTWWSLHSIECLVSSITGRPPVIANKDCTVPLPKVLPGEHEQASRSFRRPSKRSNHGSPKSTKSSDSNDAGHYLIGTINIALITQKVLTSLYAPRTAVNSWQGIQGSIRELIKELEDWSEVTIHGSDVRDIPGKQQAQSERERLMLQMHYWSVKMLITRPCLCRTERRIQNESDTSAHFNSEMATTCVKSARQLIAMFPEEPDSCFVYEKAPWWNIVHIIMQGTAVLLLEVAYQGRHTKDNNSGITADIKKMMNWLRAMQHNDPVAGRAYHVIRRILQNCAPVLKDKATELLTEDSSKQPENGVHVPPLQKQDSGTNWSQGQFYNGSNLYFDHQYQDSSQNTASAYGHDPYADPFGGQIRMPNTFGNLFVNSWDEGVPGLDINNLWGYPSFDPMLNLPGDVGDMDLLGMYGPGEQQAPGIEGNAMPFQQQR